MTRSKQFLVVQRNDSGRPCGWGVSGSEEGARVEALRQYHSHRSCYPGERVGAQAVYSFGPDNFPSVVILNSATADDIAKIEREQEYGKVPSDLYYFRMRITDALGELAGMVDAGKWQTTLDLMMLADMIQHRISADSVKMAHELLKEARRQVVKKTDEGVEKDRFDSVTFVVGEGD